MTLQDFIQSHGYNFTPTELDGTFHEFTDSQNNKGWYIGRELSTGKIAFTFGDWRKPDARFSFLSEENLTDEEKHEYESTQEKFKSEKSAKQDHARKLAQEIFARWDRVGSTGQSKYLATKGLPDRLPGTIVKPTEVGGHVLVIPMRDEHGEIWNFQSIFDDGQKQFFNFGRIEGLYFEFPVAPDSEGRAPGNTYICEGLATGAAIHLATSARVIVAFTLSNLRHIVPLFPDAAICGDWDGGTFKKMLDAGNEDAFNPGAREAVALAQEFFRTLYFPVGFFECTDNRDFADIYLEGGPGAVRAFLKTSVDLSAFSTKQSPKGRPKARPTHTTSTKPRDLSISKWINGLEPMNIPVGKNGKPNLPEEMDVARRLYDYWEGRLVKSNEGDVFCWTDKYWRHCDKRDEQTWLQQIMVLHAGFGTNARFKSVLNNFLALIPFSHRNMFSPNPYRITFNNGTLCVDFVAGKWDLTFKPHNKTDFATNIIPHDYDPTNEAMNPVFEDTLKNILGDNEYDSKRRAVAQMFGSCLSPVYPRLFLLVGKTGSGKSTLIILASKLVSDGNIAAVQPGDFQGFLMESMVGKLVNMVTDIDFVKPISDAVIKQIEDRVPIMINRKNKLAIRAPFPAVHVFGANDLPPTLERGSMAHTRRWTFIPCNFFQKEISEHDKHRVDKILEAGMQGIINFAVQGLKDLLESQGHFFVPQSGVDKMKKWQVENDPIQSFFEAVKQGEIEDLTLDPNGKIYTNVLWENFVAWHQDAYNTRPRIPKMKFYAKVEIPHGEKSKYRGHWVFRGLASKSSPVLAKDSKGGEAEFPPGEVATVNRSHEAGRQLLENSSDLF